MKKIIMVFFVFVVLVVVSCKLDSNEDEFNSEENTDSINSEEYEINIQDENIIFKNLTNTKIVIDYSEYINKNESRKSLSVKDLIKIYKILVNARDTVSFSMTSLDILSNIDNLRYDNKKGEVIATYSDTIENIAFNTVDTLDMILDLAKTGAKFSPAVLVEAIIEATDIVGGLTYGLGKYFGSLILDEDANAEVITDSFTDGAIISLLKDCVSLGLNIIEEHYNIPIDEEIILDLHIVAVPTISNIFTFKIYFTYKGYVSEGPLWQNPIDHKVDIKQNENTTLTFLIYDKEDKENISLNVKESKTPYVVNGKTLILKPDSQTPLGESNIVIDVKDSRNNLLKINILVNVMSFNSQEEESSNYDNGNNTQIEEDIEIKNLPDNAPEVRIGSARVKTENYLVEIVKIDHDDDNISIKYIDLDERSNNRIRMTFKFWCRDESKIDSLDADFKNRKDGIKFYDDDDNSDCVVEANGVTEKYDIDLEILGSEESVWIQFSLYYDDGIPRIKDNDFVEIKIRSSRL